MTAPYPRIIVLHLSILIAFGFTIGDLAENDLLVEIQQFLQPALDLLPSAVQTDGVLVVLVLVVIKTVVDVVTTRRALRR